MSQLFNSDAATETTLAAANAKITAVNTTGLATEATQTNGNAKSQIVNGANTAAVDAMGRVYVGTEGTFQLEVERKRLYGLVTEQNVTPATEQRIILIRNPSGSGKTLYLQRWTILMTNMAASSGVLRAYLAPTITSVGTTATIQNTAVGGGGAASAMLAYTAPTISANGTFAYASRVQGGDGAQPTVVEFEGSISIAPGVDVLITCTPDGTNRGVISSFLWLEK